MEPTEEQQTIVEAIAKKPKIAVIAVPGSGKTTLLRMIANEYGGSKILGLAYNNSIAKENSRVFPNNTSFKTVHSMAYQWFRNYNKQKKDLTNVRPIMLKDMLGLSANTKYNILVAIQKVFDDYCLSDSEDMYIKGDEKWLDDVKISVGSQPRIVSFVIKQANELLKLMRSDKIDEITHNFYLKEFHLYLTKNASSYTRYDIAMLDEAQDATAITKAIFSSLNASRKIMVGDPDQQLYSFIGAINALRSVEEEGYVVYPLTNSFRMPPIIADKCNTIIKMIKGYDPHVKGLATESDESIKDVAYIFRTNGQLIRWMLKAIDKDFWDWTTIRDPKGIFSTALDIAMMNMWVNEDKDHFEIKPKDFNNKHLWFVFKQFNETKTPISLFEWLYKEFADQDREIDITIKLLGEVGNYNLSIFKLFNIAKEQYSQSSHEDFKVKITTAHTSKGLEFDRVILATDYAKPYEIIFEEVRHDINLKLYKLLSKLFHDKLVEDPDLINRLGDKEDKWLSYIYDLVSDKIGEEEFEELIKANVIQSYHQKVKERAIDDWSKLDEINLVYVAASRAKKELTIPEDMKMWFDEEKLIVPLMSKFLTSWVSVIKEELGLNG